MILDDYTTFRNTACTSALLEPRAGLRLRVDLTASPHCALLHLALVRQIVCNLLRVMREVNEEIVGTRVVCAAFERTEGGCLAFDPRVRSSRGDRNP
jgi:hypothetical protein